MNKHGFSTLPTLKKKTHSLCYYSKALLNKGLERSSLNLMLQVIKVESLRWHYKFLWDVTGESSFATAALKQPWRLLITPL